MRHSSRHNGSMLGLWIIRTSDARAETLLGKVQSDLYLFAFTSAVRAHSCMAKLGAQGAPFYICGANVEAIVRDARASGVRGFIIDYDPASACFVSAHALPQAAVSRELR